MQCNIAREKRTGRISIILIKLRVLRLRTPNSWHTCSSQRTKVLHDEDSEKSERVTKAMLQMKKIDIKTLKEAYER